MSPASAEPDGRRVLEKILASKRDEISQLRRRRLPAAPPKRRVTLKRADGALCIIAEIKHRSPSAGSLSRALGVADRARAYSEAGASAISVLCDATYFDGEYEHLSRVRDACTLPVLCKEFVIDECQLDAARAFGADLALLIVRCLLPQRLEQLVRACEERDLTPLVEVHDPSEVALALDAGARVIGVNARNLETLAMHGERAARVVESLPEGVTRLYLSGIHAAKDVTAVAHGPADGVLVGECLMKQDDPRPLLRELVAAAARSP